MLLCTIISGRQILLRGQFDGSENTLPGEWRRITSADEGSGALCSLPSTRGSRYRDYAMEVREAWKAYVNSEQGAVSWQWEYIR